MKRSAKSENRWCTVRNGAISALLVTILGLVSTAPAAHAAGVTATYTLSSQWKTGYVANYSIANATTMPLSEWRLDFDLPVGQSIEHTWNGTVTQTGTHVVLTPATWNHVIKPLTALNVGMRGILLGTPYSPPLNCRINGQYCG